MPLETPARIVSELTSRGYNADREAVTLLAGADDPDAALDAAVERAPDDALKLSADHVEATLTEFERADDTIVSSGAKNGNKSATTPTSPSETEGVRGNDEEVGESGAEAQGDEGEVQTDEEALREDEQEVREQSRRGRAHDSGVGESVTDVSRPEESVRDPDFDARSLEIDGDVTGESTGTGEYGDFVSVFRDRFKRLSKQLRSRVNARPTAAVQKMPGGGETAIVGMVSDIRSTASGHWLIELEDTSGIYPCLVMKDRKFADAVDELLHDEVIAVEGTLSDDNGDGDGILFVDALYFPDVPRTYKPSTADRHVQAALISDVHVGSQEFMADAWSSFADWLHTPEAENVEYLLIAGDMVEGVGVYPNQDEELDIIDIYDQYEQFSEHLKEVPGDLEILMIPGNHDAVRLAEPQPGFDEELRDIMSVHDAQISGNPSTVTVEGVDILMYHGVSLDEVIAELPDEKASYDDPHKAMYQLLKKRHVAPQFGGKTRLAPEEKDYLVMDSVPDVFHTGHVHKLGWGKYHNVLAVNSGCWQEQTAFQKSVNIDPDAGFAPILDLDTLDMTVRRFR
ncbi:DNA-directed DNA polymerase II small subunit [Halorussus pelagicus]|uniref:DNA-directed DNA polymerase II small subunit n=1 Tax=Halorussus pelagicus TaxID=2505977 RepID=UPI000FFBE604|nr:DNA-directed DNA polymerase II small subunit [Halorussus pelagicus]